MTKQKELVLRIIEQSHKHPTAEEVFFQAREEMKGIALSTVYRNINALVGEGLIKRISMLNNPDRFDNVREDHDHLICKKCGKLKDIQLIGVEKAIEEVTGENISSYELNAYYLCEECN